MSNDALGMIEVTGFLSMVAAADSALKAANVKIANVEKIKGGLSTVSIVGDVGAVQAAIAAAESEIEQLGTLISSHVIPRVDPMVLKMEIGTKKETDKIKDKTEGLVEKIKEKK
ncbi:BMC domain-containing protein [Vagococcus fluvialis]|uniref:BMC domain-containing protein n=1 Tax=Vagococcus fluvialis TaxID=2738 RepID=UPI001D0ABBF2|nr:BMC domain-containing protein [Vagococcus fluvialis]UDM71553.1 BMC domain-containing protein [Vagococcus fluvialis]UDM76414.1 BMC domain-containing protein [Vagococcus fluvialis]UDM83244.1 BMC domain-containing protein [Vagococcus fluvialis]